MKYNFEAMSKLVASNNRSTLLSDNLVICLIWKESAFDDAVKNSTTSATGLMQITRAAVDDVNRNTPSGIHFTHAEMTDAAKNIQCGTYYLDMRIRRASNDKKKGIERYGTGSGYADNIINCENCIEQKRSGAKGTPNAFGFTTTVTVDVQSCLFEIHK